MITKLHLNIFVVKQRVTLSSITDTQKSFVSMNGIFESYSSISSCSKSLPSVQLTVQKLVHMFANYAKVRKSWAEWLYIYTISSAMTVSVKWIEIENQTKKSNCKHHEVHYIVCYMLFNDFVCGVFSHTPNRLWFSGRPRGLLKVLHPQKREGVSV